MIDPALKGTLNVLQSGAKFSYVKPVVFTSSVAAAVLNRSPTNSGVVVDATCFHFSARLSRSPSRSYGFANSLTPMIPILSRIVCSRKIVKRKRSPKPLILCDLGLFWS